MYETLADAEAALSQSGFWQVSLAGGPFWAAQGVEMRFEAGGLLFDAPWACVERNRCEHCGRADWIRRPAYSVEEAVERGLLVRAADYVKGQDA